MRASVRFAPEALGDKLSAQQAADWGLIWKCVDDADFASTVDALLEQLAQAPTRGLVATRRALHASSSATLEAQLAERHAAVLLLLRQRFLQLRTGDILAEAHVLAEREGKLDEAKTLRAQLGAIRGLTAAFLATKDEKYRLAAPSISQIASSPTCIACESYAARTRSRSPSAIDNRSVTSACACGA